MSSTRTQLDRMFLMYFHTHTPQSHLTACSNTWLRVVLERRVLTPGCVRVVLEHSNTSRGQISVRTTDMCQHRATTLLRTATLALPLGGAAPLFSRTILGFLHI